MGKSKPNINPTAPPVSTEESSSTEPIRDPQFVVTQNVQGANAQDAYHEPPPDYQSAMNYPTHAMPPYQQSAGNPNYPKPPYPDPAVHSTYPQPMPANLVYGVGSYQNPQPSNPVIVQVVRESSYLRCAHCQNGAVVRETDVCCLVCLILLAIFTFPFGLFFLCCVPCSVHRRCDTCHRIG